MSSEKKAKKIEIEDVIENDETLEPAVADDEPENTSVEEGESEIEDENLSEEEPVIEDIPAEGVSEKDHYLRRMKQLEEGNLRLRAEFSNYKRRIEREQAEFSNYLKGELLKKFLPVLDDFKMMVDKGNSGSEESTLEGAKIIFEKFQQILEKEGLQKIDALGSSFDPQMHEALMMKTIDDAEENDKIVEVFQEGFTLNERLLRPSKVIVGKFENN